MSGDISKVWIVDKRAGEVVEALLYDGITEAHLEDVEKRWMQGSNGSG